VSSTGIFNPTAAGTATIKATSTQDTTKSGTASVIVTPPAPLQHGALLTSPPLYASAIATPVTVSIWLPDPDLTITSVTAFETDKNGVILSTKGTLNDSGTNGDAKAGDKVYTLQFTVTDSAPVTHYYAVSYTSISSGATFSTEVDSTTSVPIVGVTGPSSYSSNIQDSINRLLSGATSYQAIYPSSATAINQTALDSYTATIASVMGNIQQLSSYDSTNPLVAHARFGSEKSAIMPMSGGFSFWSLIPFGLGDILKKNNELAPEKVAFLGPSFNPSDPAVAGVMTWLAKNPNYEAACDPDIVHDATCRAVIWTYYAESPDAGLLEAAKSSATSFAVSEYTPDPIDGAGDLLASQTDLAPLTVWSIEQGAGIATDYFVDNFTAPSGRQMLVLGNVSQGQNTLLPNGSHDIILASSTARSETPGVISPAISNLAPSLLLAGAAPQTLVINGIGFQASSTVTFNDNARGSIFVSANQLTIQLNSADLGTAGTYPVVVTNPAPGGGASAAANFVVANAQAAGQWTWMGGSNIAGAASVYGTTGVPDPANDPGARMTSVSWTDSSGNLWLFGGCAGSCTSGGFNDLWAFNPTSNEWTSVSGNTNGTGIYGTLGVPDVANIPPGRSFSTSGIDGSGKFWIFGGHDYSDTDSNTFYFNDLWNYDPATKEWTWASGGVGAQDGGSYGKLGVPDPANVPSGRERAVSWIDNSGSFWVFGGQGNFQGWYIPFNDFWNYDPTTKEWTWVGGGFGGDGSASYGTKGIPAAANVPGGRYDAVSWKDSSGNLWFFGGAFGSFSGSSGSLNDLWEFNPTSGLWTWVSGANTANQPGVYGTQGIPAAGNIPGARSGPVSWTDKNGNFWLFGGFGVDSVGSQNYLNDLWEFNPSNNMWTWIGGSSTTPGTNQVPGVYGTKGIPAATNIPGGRSYSASWTDKNGYLWLFGGNGYDSTGSGLLNDLWRYQP
jgi:N-acetylneuraminic acid mutarotase